MTRLSSLFLLTALALAPLLSGCADEFVGDTSALQTEASGATTAALAKGPDSETALDCSAFFNIEGEDIIYAGHPERYTLSAPRIRGCNLHRVEWSVTGGARIDSANQPGNPNPAFVNVSYYRPTMFTPWTATITATIVVFTGPDGDEALTFTKSKTVKVRTNPPSDPQPQSITVSLADVASGVGITWGYYAGTADETYTACATRIFSQGGPPRTNPPPSIPCTTLSSLTDVSFAFSEDEGYWFSYRVRITDSAGKVVAQGESGTELLVPTY